MSRSKRPSVSFERAAGYYDAARSLSPEAAVQVTAVLAEALVGHGPALAAEQPVAADHPQPMGRPVRFRRYVAMTP